MAPGAIQVLRNADGGGGGHIFWGKALPRCKAQRHSRYEGVGGGPISWGKALRNTWMAPKQRALFL